MFVLSLSRHYIQTLHKGDIPQDLESFRLTLSNSHSYNTRNGELGRLPMLKTKWGKRIIHYRCTGY